MKAFAWCMDGSEMDTITTEEMDGTALVVAIITLVVVQWFRETLSQRRIPLVKSQLNRLLKGTDPTYGSNEKGRLLQVVQHPTSQQLLQDT